MRSLKYLSAEPNPTPLTADDLVEFHAARLLLLLQICGIDGQIEGLTKMAKLDFFVRYPQFFAIAAQAVRTDAVPSAATIESTMIRYHYGPWDPRYYDVLAYLQAHGLVEVRRVNTTVWLQLTALGQEIAGQIGVTPAFTVLVEQMQHVAAAFKHRKGTYLKKLIYRVFDEQVAQRTLGEVID